MTFMTTFVTHMADDLAMTGDASAAISVLRVISVGLPRTLAYYPSHRPPPNLLP
jgi:hypothetical protein